MIIVEDDESASGVCCALAIHAIIRANDALCLKFLKLKPTKHDDVSHIFSDLIKHKKLAPTGKRFIKLLEDAMTDKSGADYGKEAFDCKDAKGYVEDAEEFVSFAKGYV